jgi:hypothetical protein
LLGTVARFFEQQEVDSFAMTNGGMGLFGKDEKK